MPLPQNMDPTIPDYKDILILLILTYLVVQVIINIYTAIKGTDEPIIDINYKVKNNKDIELFHGNNIGDSLHTLNNTLYLKLPGDYKETIYRPSTITPIIQEMVYHLTNPIIKHINKEEGYKFVIGNIIYIICQEYTGGTIYFMELVIIDGGKPLTIILTLEQVLYMDGLSHINRVGIKNSVQDPLYLNMGSGHLAGVSDNKHTHNTNKPTDIISLKKNILPNRI